MRKLYLTLLACLLPTLIFATTVLEEGFEYANHDMETPIGWVSDNNAWLCGYLEKDHNRMPHTGDWYAFTNANDSWLFLDMFFGNDLRYRYNFWCISDGTYDVEFWVGDSATPDGMSQMLFTKTVSGGEYEFFSEYIESIYSSSLYLGIRAIAHEGAQYLTIDDISIDMVSRYDLDVTPNFWDTVLFTGEQITVDYDVANIGYEDLHVFMAAHSDYFTDASFTEDGFAYASFPTVPNQTVHCTCTATLMDGLAPGTRCWIDIIFTVSCDCLSRMATLWVTVGDPTAVEENVNENQMLSVEVYDLTGRKVDPSNLRPGTYIERTITTEGVATRKFVKQ